MLPNKFLSFLMQYILHQQYPMQRCCIESSRGGRLQIRDGLARGYIGGGTAMQLVLSTTSRVHASIHVWQALPSTMSRVHASIHVWRMCLCVCVCLCACVCVWPVVSCPVYRSIGRSVSAPTRLSACGCACNCVRMSVCVRVRT
jgi:hypothetical protein